MPPDSTNPALHRPISVALALSLGAAISLGISRFSYGLLLPPMRADLEWSYFLAGAMNTGNALGYFIGALATPYALRRWSAQASLLGGSLATALFMLLSGFVADAGLLMLQRVLAGIASAFVFIAGGLLAARLGALHPRRAGLLIGLYYGGTGLGIVLSSLLVPSAMEAAQLAHASHTWQPAWMALGLTCLAATGLMMKPAQSLDGRQITSSPHAAFRKRDLAFGLTGYFMFGVGYIGYMTFVIALLRERNMSPASITLFYTLLGIAVLASSRIWARTLDRFKGGGALALLNTLLGCATLLPALTSSQFAVFVSGILFGAVFLSVVASTTAMVRHNLAPAAWPSGIGLFTTVFAFGQIIGPSVTGWIADSGGGLRQGLIFSGIALFAGALLATRQRSLPIHSGQRENTFSR